MHQMSSTYKNPTLDCHIFNGKLTNYPKEWTDQVRDKMLFLMKTGIRIPISACSLPLPINRAPWTSTRAPLQFRPASQQYAGYLLLMTSTVYTLNMHISRELPLLQFILIHIISISWAQSWLKHSIISSAPPFLLRALNIYYRSKQSNENLLDQEHQNQSNRCNSIPIKALVLWSFTGS